MDWVMVDSWFGLLRVGVGDEGTDGEKRIRKKGNGRGICSKIDQGQERERDLTRSSFLLSYFPKATLKKAHDGMERRRKTRKK